jgi:hypothetical protein
MTWSASLIRWNVVLWFARKPRWLAFSKFLSSVCFWIILKISFSKSLPVAFKRFMRRKFGENFGSFLGFDRFMNFAFFQGAWKWPSRRQWLHKCVTCTGGLLWRCRRYLFGMPSKPQTFPNFKDYISFESSQGRKLTGMSSSTVASRASTWAFTCRLWWQAHKSCVLNRFSKQSVIMLGVIDWIKYEVWGTVYCRWCLWSTPFCEVFFNRPFCLRCDFAVCQRCFPFSSAISGPFSWYFEWHSLLSYYMLAPWFLTIMFWAFLYASIDDLGQQFRISGINL